MSTELADEVLASFQSVSRSLDKARVAEVNGAAAVEKELDQGNQRLLAKVDGMATGVNGMATSAAVEKLLLEVERVGMVGRFVLACSLGLTATVLFGLFLWTEGL